MLSVLKYKHLAHASLVFLTFGDLIFVKVVVLASTEPLVESSEDLSISFYQTSGTHLKLTLFPKFDKLLKSFNILLWSFTPTSFCGTSNLRKALQ